MIIGWTGIAGTMLTAQRSEGGAGISPATTLDIFSIASSFSCLSQLFLGIIQDKYNPKVCSIISNTIVGVGCFVFVFSDEVLAIYLGCTMMGVGGPGVQLSLIHLANLFPRKENTVMSFMTGMINMSFIVLPVMNSIWSRGIVSYQFLFRSLGFVILAMALASVWIWPNVTYTRVVYSDDDHDDVASSGDSHSVISGCSERADIVSLSGQGRRMDIETTNHFDSTRPCAAQITNIRHARIRRIQIELVPVERSFREQICSGRLIRLAIFFVVTSFWANYYIGSMTIEVRIKWLLFCFAIGSKCQSLKTHNHTLLL